MRKRFLFPVACAFAIQFTLSCTEDNDDVDQPSSSGGWVSSSSVESSSSSAVSPSSSSVVASSSSRASSSSVERSSSSVAPSSSAISSSSYSDGDSGDDISNYRTVRIGTQTWMAENLNYNVSGSKCYNNEESNCAIYGRLYNWTTAMALPSDCNRTPCSSQISSKHRGICPSGWHIPSDDEWTTLTDFVGEDAGTKLKSKTGWESYSDVPSGTDEYGFSALPGGNGDSDGSFHYVGKDSYWWSASNYGSNYAYNRHMFYGNEDVYYINGGKDNLFSVRCVQD